MEALTKDLNIGLRAINSEISKKVINEGIKNASELYKYGKGWVTNKIFKKALIFDDLWSNYIAERAEEPLFNWENE